LFVGLIEALFGDDASILRRTQYQLLLLANVNAALGTVLLSPLLESLTGPFGVTEVRAGLLVTVFTAPGIVAIPLVGMLADRYGRKPVLVLSLLLFGSAGAGIGFTTDFGVALWLRVLQGIGYAGILPVVVTCIGDLYEGDREATAQGLRFTSSGAAQATLPALAGVLVVASWRYPFYFFALALPVAAFVYRWFDEPDTTTSADDGDESYVHTMLWLVRQPRVFAALVGIAVPAFLYIGFLTYNSFLVVRVLGGTPGDAGLVITVVSVVYGSAASQAGRITAFFGNRTAPMLGANVLMGAGLAVFALAPSLPVAFVGVAIMGLGTGTALSLIRSIITGIAPPEYRGGLVGIGESTLRLGNSAAPLLMGSSIAFLQPWTGFDASVRFTILGAGVVGALVGVLAILLLRVSSAVPESA
jgi:MFS family permease